MSGTVYTYPNLQEYFPETFTAEIRSNVTVSSSGADGSVRTVEIPGARWYFDIGYPRGADRNRRRKIEALWGKIRGQANRVKLWHFVRPQPSGTMRGSPTIVGTVAAGATSFTITGAAGSTFNAGDFLQVGTQLIMNVEDATADGSNHMLITSNVPLRTGASNGDAVIWDRPVGVFMTVSSGVPIPHGVSEDPAFTVSLVETFT